MRKEAGGGKRGRSCNQCVGGGGGWPGGGGTGIGRLTAGGLMANMRKEARRGKWVMIDEGEEWGREG